MNAIVAVDNNYGIGYKDNLLAKIPGDMKFFRETTMGHVVVLGRKTLAGFPKAQPLKGRTNIVISGNAEYEVEGAVVVHSKEELLAKLKGYDDDDIFIIGGGSVYEMMLPYCKYVYLTKIKNSYTADTYFPNLDNMDNWKVVEETEEYDYDDGNSSGKYAFFKYENENVLTY